MDKNASFGALCATDALGRKLPTQAQAGALRQDRVVGMFYFLTHGAYGPDARGPADVTKILKEHPEAIWDFDHPAWCDGAPLYWGEPLFGYYYLDDKWVLRRHIKLLTMAGVDFLVFDTTNRKTFFPQVRGILEVLEEYRREGFRVPQIAYYTNTKSGETVNEIYEDLYKPGLYPELWFRWEGKPFIIGAKEECTPEQQEFFTFRAPQWPTEHKKPLACPWIDFERPQRAWTGPDGENEIVPVSVAQHPNISFGDAAFYGEPSTRGRNFHGCANDKTPEAILYGYNMAEQWERAIALDPKMVFFTERMDRRQNPRRRGPPGFDGGPGQLRIFARCGTHARRILRQLLHGALRLHPPLQGRAAAARSAGRAGHLAGSRICRLGGRARLLVHALWRPPARRHGRG